MKTTFYAAAGSADRAIQRVARQREVENALLMQALCNWTVSPATLAQLRRYEAGELPREQAFAGLYQGVC